MSSRAAQTARDLAIEARYAIAREKEIKGWRREKKNDLVRTLNPKWEDLGQKILNLEL